MVYTGTQTLVASVFGNLLNLEFEAIAKQLQVQASGEAASLTSVSWVTNCQV